MHPRIGELLAYFDAQRAALRAAVDAVPVDARERPPADGAWSVANVIEHLAIVEGRIAKYLGSAIERAKSEGLAAESSSTPILPTLGVERLADREVKVAAPEMLHPKGLDAKAAWTELEHASAALRETIRSGDGFALGTLTLPHALFGPLSLYQWIAFVGAHEARHAAQINEIAASLSHA
jgi:uncharacterized damage-inducible protein DinB